MSVITIALGTRTQLTGAAAALNSLANGTYVVLGTVVFASSGKTPLDCKLEISVTPGTVSSLKQVSIFAQESLDNTNFSTGPSSGTTVTDEADLKFIGVIPCGTNAVLQRGIFALASRFGGMLPFSAKIIAKNETGAALASTGNDVYTLTGNGDVT